MSTELYSRGKIYKLVCGDLTYYGSTCQPLYKRKASHKSSALNWKEGTTHPYTSYILFEIGDPEIFLVEDFPCDKKEQLHARERHFIENFECVNKNIPTRTIDEYNLINKEKIKSYNSVYKEYNKERLKEYNIHYRNENKDQKNKSDMKYYHDNIEAIKEKRQTRCTCSCGKEINIAHKSRHYTTSYHINNTK
jgi:hypothetical protein